MDIQSTRRWPKGMEKFSSASGIDRDGKEEKNLKKRVHELQQGVGLIIEKDYKDAVIGYLY